MPFAGLGAGGFAEHFEAFVDALDLRFGLGEVLLEQLAQLIEAGGLRHLGKRLGQLLLGMQDIAQLVDEQIAETRFVRGRRALGDDGRGRTRFARLDRRRLREHPVAALVPRAARVDLAMVAGAGGIVEELVHEAGRRRDAADAERWLAHALERERERLHVRDLAGHQELQRVLAAGVVAEIDQPLVDDLGPRLRGDVAAQIDVKLAGDLQIVGGPGIALGVEEIDAAAAGDGDEGSASAAWRSNFDGLRCIRASVPTTSRWLSSSVPMSISRSLRSGSSQFNPWIEYCIAAASSPLAPPNCSSSMLPKRGSGSSTRTVNISFLTW